MIAGVATEQLVRHYPPVFIPPTPQSTRSRLKHFLAHLPKTARKGELQVRVETREGQDLS